MMRTRFVPGVAALCLGGLLSGSVLSQTPPAKAGPQPTALTDEVVTIPLWEGGAPGALGTADADRPTLTVYRARTAVPTGIIVARRPAVPSPKKVGATAAKETSPSTTRRTANHAAVTTTTAA